MISLLAPITLGALGFLAISQGESNVGRRLYNLPDVEPENQGGSFNRDYDFYFETSADDSGVPFALLKAHAIMESSLNPAAFRDENPKNRADRQGWASRGLMQILWWPGSERWKKYGFGDATLGVSGVRMFEPQVNLAIASKLIRDNLNACNGNLRDAINMYNSGKKESEYVAPYEYVDRVLKNYSTLIGRSVL